MERSISGKIDEWYKGRPGTALLVDGARQVGKTYIIRDFLEKNCGSFVEINFLDLKKEELERFSSLTSADQLVTLVSVVYRTTLIPGKSVVFFDEVQECLNVMTVVKFLVEDGRFRYILSGSLLGVEMSGVRSLPAGYMSVLHMYPMDFEEFCLADGVLPSVMDGLRGCFEEENAAEDYIHERFMEMYRLHLAVGGMPQAVKTYVDTRSLEEVLKVQRDICEIYRSDISKYDKPSRPMITDVFDKIPSELNSRNKRFRFKSLSGGGKYRDAESAFLWLTDAGVAIPVCCVDEPRHPLRLSESGNLMKLFMCDTGLLTSLYMKDSDDTLENIMMGKGDADFGAVYENAVAQELVSHGYTPHYYNSKRTGELDLVIDRGGKAVPIEIKSGKGYNRHSALDNVLSATNFDIDTAYVFSNRNTVARVGKKVYMPVYMSAFIRHDPPKDEK